MVLDFHVHTFPDALAPRTISKLAVINAMEPSTDGTVSGTRSRMEEWGIDRAVLLNVATKPTQQTTINNCAAAITDEHFIPFGAIHPDAPDVIDELYRIKELGLRGIKLHPDYQNFFINEDRMAPIYETMAKLHLPVVFHTGYDPISPEVIHAVPKAVAEVADAFPELTIIAAHLGGAYQSDDVERYLVEKHLYFDTALACIFCKEEQFTRIVRSHGADKILFASDTPWGNSRTALDFLEASSLTEEEKEKIRWTNGAKLLGLL